MSHFKKRTLLTSGCSIYAFSSSFDILVVSSSSQWSCLCGKYLWTTSNHFNSLPPLKHELLLINVELNVTKFSYSLTNAIKYLPLVCYPHLWSVVSFQFPVIAHCSQLRAVSCHTYSSVWKVCPLQIIVICRGTSSGYP